MLKYPILINRPIVVTPWGVKLCRPSEAVLDILPLPQKGPFAKEDGEPLIDSEGRLIPNCFLIYSMSRPSERPEESSC